MGRVRITIVITVPVVSTMVRDPVEWTVLSAHAAEDHQDPFDRARRRKGAVGEQSMKPERDAQPGGENHYEERDHGVRRQSVLQRHDHGNGSADQCEDRGVDKDYPAKAADGGPLRHHHCHDVRDAGSIT